MADALGHLSLMGIRSGIATWATAYSAVDTPIPFNSEGLTQAYEEIEKNALMGSGAKEPSDQGNLEVVGPTTHELDFNNFDKLLEAIFGTVSTRTFTITDDTLAKYYWVEFEKQVERWRFGACKANKLTISGEKGGIIMATFEHVARLCNRVGTAYPLSAPTNVDRMLFEHLQFRLGDQTDALAAGDKMQIDSFEFALERALKTDDYVNNTDGIYKVEPVPEDMRKVTFSVSFPRYAANTLQGWKDNNTPLQADLLFTRSSETFKLELPELRITEGFNANIEGTGPIRQEGTFRAFKSSNTYMYTGNEARITIT